MPTVRENVKKWGETYHWSHQGDEWAEAWGGPPMQWYGTLLPRIQRFVPANRILEIACGYGRWTQFLREMCSHLTAVEISEECIRKCKTRFSEFTNIEYHLNDGKSLEMIPDHSIDFVFSFDSLVHADLSVLDAYISQFPRILTNDGAAFLHHSNLAEYSRRNSLKNRSPLLGRVMSKLGVWDKTHHWRDPGVSAQLVKQSVQKHGLTCSAQEIVHWGTKRAKIDCFTTIVNSPFQDNEVQPLVNNHFMEEAAGWRRLSGLYNTA